MHTVQMSIRHFLNCRHYACLNSRPQDPPLFTISSPCSHIFCRDFLFFFVAFFSFQYSTSIPAPRGQCPHRRWLKGTALAVLSACILFLNILCMFTIGRRLWKMYSAFGSLIVDYASTHSILWLFVRYVVRDWSWANSLRRTLVAHFRTCRLPLDNACSWCLNCGSLEMT